MNDQKLVANAVMTPAAPPTTFAPIRAGTRPKRSAIQPNNRPPVIAPQKNTDCKVHHIYKSYYHRAHKVYLPVLLLVKYHFRTPILTIDDS